MNTNKIIFSQKSETAKAICKYYFSKYGSTSIFNNPNEVENAIDLSIRRGARTPSEIRKETINFLNCLRCDFDALRD